MPAKLRYWQKTRRFTLALLAVWAGVTFGVNWFARELNQFTLMGFPFGFYMGAQGALLLYLVIIWWYNRRMDRLDADARRDDVG